MLPPNRTILNQYVFKVLVFVVEATDPWTSGLPFTSRLSAMQFPTWKCSCLITHRSQCSRVARIWNLRRRLNNDEAETRSTACHPFRRIQWHKRRLCLLVYILHSSKQDCSQEEQQGSGLNTIQSRYNGRNKVIKEWDLQYSCVMKHCCFSSPVVVSWCFNPFDWIAGCPSTRLQSQATVLRSEQRQKLLSVQITHSSFPFRLLQWKSWHDISVTQI